MISKEMKEIFIYLKEKNEDMKQVNRREAVLIH